MKKEHSPKCDVVKYPTIAQACTCHKHPPMAPAPTASAREWPESAGYRAIFVRYDNFYILDPLDANEGKEVGRVVMSKRGFDAIAEAYASSQSSKLEGVGQNAAEKFGRECGFNKILQQKVAAIIDELIAGRLACK